MSEDKRKRKVLTIEEKLKAIERLNKGETIVKVARDLGVGKATVGEWKHKKEDLENWCEKYASNEKCKHRKSTKAGDFEDVGRELHKWFVERRDSNCPVECQALKEKALELFKELRNEDNEDLDKFQASDGWLNRWKTRYGIQQMTIRPEGAPPKPRKPRKRKMIREFPLDEDSKKSTKTPTAPSSTRTLEALDTEPEIRPPRKISHGDAVEAFDTVILYLEQQDDAAANIEIALLKRLRDIATLKQSAASSKKQ